MADAPATYALFEVVGYTPVSPDHPYMVLAIKGLGWLAGFPLCLN